MKELLQEEKALTAGPLDELMESRQYQQQKSADDLQKRIVEQDRRRSEREVDLVVPFENKSPWTEGEEMPSPPATNISPKSSGKTVSKNLSVSDTIQKGIDSQADEFYSDSDLLMRKVLKQVPIINQPQFPASQPPPL